MCPAVPTTTDRIVFVTLRVFVVPSAPPRLAAHLPFAAAGPLLPLLFELRLRLRPSRTALPFAHAFEDLDQAEIDLAQVHVDADHLDLHLVTQAIHLVRVLAAQQVGT